MSFENLVVGDFWEMDDGVWEILRKRHLKDDVFELTFARVGMIEDEWEGEVVAPPVAEIEINEEVCLAEPEGDQHEESRMIARRLPEGWPSVRANTVLG
jgi:hypothetical protein